MHKRRDIREAAVQFLYLADLEDPPENGEQAQAMEPSFWSLVQENSLRKLTKARAKALLHIAQGRPARIEALDTQATTLLALLKADGQQQKLITAMRRLIKAESQTTSTMDALGTASHSKSDDAITDTLIHDALGANAATTLPRKEWRLALEDHPAWKPQAEAFNAAVTHLERISLRIIALDSPDSGIPHIQKTASEIEGFRCETNELVRGVLTHKQSIDDAIKNVVENYSPQRINPVDRAILRLASYELLHCPDIPAAVSINEAIEIAKRFSTSESARFINGILDALKNE